MYFNGCIPLPRHLKKNPYCHDILITATFLGLHYRDNTFSVSECLIHVPVNCMYIDKTCYSPRGGGSRILSRI